ncbi:MAG TPA: hemerythrin domain-containing protein [Azospirillum sp.]
MIGVPPPERPGEGNGAALTPIRWSADLECGIAAIDIEHQTLVALYNDLVRAVGHGTSGWMTRSVLHTLKNHFLDHVAHEERWMRTADYPGHQAHRDAHEGAARMLESIVADPDAQRAVHAAGRHLRDWIMEHIAVTDRDFFAFLNAAGTAPPAASGAQADD